MTKPKNKSQKLTYLTAQFDDLETLEPQTKELSKEEVIKLFSAKIETLGVEAWVSTFLKDYRQVKEKSR